MLSLSSFDPSGFKVLVERRIFTGDNKKKIPLEKEGMFANSLKRPSL